MKTTHSHTKTSLSKKTPGELVFPTDYRGYGTEDAIKKALSRLAREEKLRRLSRGIYYIPNDQRRATLSQAAQASVMRAEVIEKDWWVTLTKQEDICRKPCNSRLILTR